MTLELFVAGVKFGVSIFGIVIELVISSKSMLV